MNWPNVRLILAREIRDQLRDRRTLFMIAVLPMLLYPLLGMSMFQIAQFVRENATDVLVVGAGDLEGLPPLVADGRFAPGLFSDPAKDARLLEVHVPESTSAGKDQPIVDTRAEACRAVEAGRYAAVLYFPENFGDQARAFQRAIQQWRQENGDGARHDEDAPVLKVHPEIIYSTASEESQITFARLSDVWRRWNEQIGRSNLTARGLPANAAQPFELATTNLADQTGRHGAAVWAKVLPVLLLLWAMTGAFYPAVDLCAGEKERGTLETLLCSPAERSEIVVGKLLTIMLFSAATAVLNLLSLGITGWLVLAKLPQFGAPPPTAALWLAVALVPVSALFSALCLALAAFARSSKEGQYYLIPLLLVTLPLVILPMAPGVELNLGNSLIPVTGVVLLLRSMLEGSHWQAMQFAAPVVAVTLACCLMAIRWAVEQFNSESVLFRESERLDVGLWIRHLLVDRRPTPTVAAAVTCGVVILLVRFFMSFAVSEPGGFRGFTAVALATQLVVVLAPTLLMTWLLTSSPRQTLLLRRPPRFSLAAAAALAVVLHPTVHAVQSLVARLYPINADFQKAVEEIFREAPGFWQLVAVVAVVPAVCEELAFRGFILSGFRHLGSKQRAIVYSALFFGFTHGVLQQSIVASLLGVVIGYVAVQTGSILPGMAFHLIHNSVAVAVTRPEVAQALSGRGPGWAAMLFTVEQGGFAFRWPAVLLSVVLASMLLAWFARLPYAKSEEERRRDAILKGARDT